MQCVLSFGAHPIMFLHVTETHVHITYICALHIKLSEPTRVSKRPSLVRSDVPVYGYVSYLFYHVDIMLYISLRSTFIL